MKYLFIDTETTGLNPRSNGLIQIAGMIEVDEKKIESFNFHLKPFPQDQIEESALKVNGISRETLLTYPEPQTIYAQMIALFNQTLTLGDPKEKIHFVAYNARFDWDFTAAFFKKNGSASLFDYCYFPPLDVMSLAAEYFKRKRRNLKDFKLGTVSRAAGISLHQESLHEALYDVEITRQLYQTITGSKVSPTLDTLF